MGSLSPADKPALVWAPLAMGQHVLPGACFSKGYRWICAPLWTFMGCWDAAASPWSLQWTAGESHLGHLEHLLLLFLHSPGCLQGCSSSHIFSCLFSLATNYFCAITFLLSSKYVLRGSTTIPDWLGLGQQWVCLRAS